MDILIEGLQIYGYHGVLPEEKSLGQQFVFDLRLTMAECRGADTDEMTDTVDYTEVIDVVSEVAAYESYDLLERLAAAVGKSLLARFPVDVVWVKVSKPHPPVPCSVRGVGVACELRRRKREQDFA